MYTTKKDKGNPLPAVCRKTSIVVKNGVWGVAPRQVAGTPVPVFSPFFLFYTESNDNFDLYRIYVFFIFLSNIIQNL